MKNLQRERDILMSVDHPNITKLYLALRVNYLRKTEIGYRMRKISTLFMSMYNEAHYLN